jgi:hypothetical protein
MSYNFQDERDYDGKERDEILRDEAADEKQVRKLEEKYEGRESTEPVSTNN